MRVLDQETGRFAVCNRVDDHWQCVVCDGQGSADLQEGLTNDQALALLLEIGPNHRIEESGE